MNRYFNLCKSKDSTQSYWIAITRDIIKQYPDNTLTTPVFIRKAEFNRLFKEYFIFDIETDQGATSLNILESWINTCIATENIHSINGACDARKYDKTVRQYYQYFAAHIKN